ncbi:MAG TPA: DNA methyltransferase [Terriglobia bacterium]|nr:DNA methyltransferase [Terriglobia bacterium]
MYCGKAEEILRRHPLTLRKKHVQLIFTSPPFPLNRKKKYGNFQGKAYVDWLAGFAELFRSYLRDDGSLVVELGNAWEVGKPVMSTLALKALLALQEAGKFYLCQEFICYTRRDCRARPSGSRSRESASRMLSPACGGCHPIHGPRLTIGASCGNTASP